MSLLPLKQCLLLTSILMSTFGAFGQDQSNPILDTASLTTLEQLVGKNPDSLSYHEAYVDAFRRENGATYSNADSVIRLMVPQYEKWIKKYPKSAIVPFALGEAFANAESPGAKPYLLKATQIDPNYAPAWLNLSIDAERWGDTAGSTEYMHKATLADPNNPTYAFYYVMDFELKDPAAWKAKTYELIKKFPKSERGPQALYWLANRNPDPAKKIKTYEELRSLYSPKTSSWTEAGMQELFALYLEKDPAKAKELTLSMLPQQGWARMDSIAGNFVEAKSLMDKGQFQTAADILADTKSTRYPDLSPAITTFYAQAEAKAGHPEKAYEKLMRLYAANPTDQLMDEIKKYSGKLSKGQAQIQQDLAILLEKGGKLAPSFNLGLYTSDGKATLADYKGKVVLLTFWFPGCGPCRGEFPHFQNVVNKFKGQEVAYIGINVDPFQDPYVLPFMKGTGYTFTPLRGNSDWAMQTYKVRGEPTNFLIDPNGKIMYQDFRIGADNEETLELMIRSLLSKPNSR